MSRIKNDPKSYIKRSQISKLACAHREKSQDVQKRSTENFLNAKIENKYISFKITPKG